MAEQEAKLPTRPVLRSFLQDAQSAYRIGPGRKTLPVVGPRLVQNNTNPVDMTDDLRVRAVFNPDEVHSPGKQRFLQRILPPPYIPHIQSRTLNGYIDPSSFR